MLHLVWWDRQLHPTLDRSIVTWCNEMQPVLAPSLTTLILGNLKPPEMRRKGQLTVSQHEAGCPGSRPSLCLQTEGEEILTLGKSHICPCGQQGCQSHHCAL